MMGEGEEGMEGRKDERSEGGGRREGGRKEERKKGRISWSLCSARVEAPRIVNVNVYSRRKVR